jgi:signal transduction histidine kinase
VQQLVNSLEANTADHLDKEMIDSMVAPVDLLGMQIRDAISEAALTSESESRQREFLEALLNEITDAIFILDSQREIRFLNEAARHLFPSEQIYQERPFLDVCRDHRIYDTLSLAEEIGAKVSENIVMRLHDSKTGRIREVNLHIEAEPLRFAINTSDSGSWILLKDITAELETEQIRRDFVANASHELRTPLSIINGYLETMDDAEIDLNQALFRRAVRTMHKHGQRIARIVDDMLMISKLENAQDLLNVKPFDLRDSLNEMISQLMPLIEEKHARVTIDTGSREDWILAGDRYYWDQIFFNLIENALKQNREPGLRITIRFQAENGRYLISISDDGIGIPAQDLPLIFKRFYRVQKHHSQNEVKGTGLGLSIVKRAVEAHRGEVKVDSRAGIETIFTISVPDTSIPAAANMEPGRKS